MEKTAFQIFSTRRTDRRSPRGFTLVEVMIGASISSFLLAGILSTFLLMGRSSANIVNYTDIEAKARASLEQFSREVHVAYDVGLSFSSTSVTLSIPDTSPNRIPNPAINDPATGLPYTGNYTVTYTFDTANKRLTRTGPPINNPTGASDTTIMITGVEQIPGTPFLNYYKYAPSLIIGQGYTNGVGTNIATTLGEIQQIEVSFLLKRQSVTVATATNKVLSARFILRNK